jgi:hypothetical protein
MEWAVSSTNSKPDPTRQDVANILENFLTGKGGDWDWGAFTQGAPFDDPLLEVIRVRCALLSEEFPPANKRHYTNEGGLQVIRDYIDLLRAP